MHVVREGARSTLVGEPLLYARHRLSTSRSDTEGCPSLFLAHVERRRPMKIMPPYEAASHSSRRRHESKAQICFRHRNSGPIGPSCPCHREVDTRCRTDQFVSVRYSLWRSLENALFEQTPLLRSETNSVPFRAPGLSV